MPPLPAYYGQMVLDQPIAYLSIGATPQTGYRVGEKLGEFKVESITLDSIVFDLNEKKVEKKLAELIPKEPAPVQAAPAQTPVAANSGAVSLTGPAADNFRDPAIGAELTEQFRACVPGDTSPVGTEKSGYRERSTPSPPGPVCLLERTN